MEDRVAPSLHFDGPAHVIGPCALASGMKSYRTVQSLNANYIYSIITSLLFTPSKVTNGKY